MAVQAMEPAEMERPLRWLMVLRAVTVTAILISAFGIQLLLRPDETLRPLFHLAAAAYGMVLVAAILERWLAGKAAFLCLQLAGDALVVTGFVEITGAIDSPMSFLYPGEPVEVTMEDHGASVRVGICDRGPGIPENFRGRIFGRFAQADSSMSRQKSGTGLGLAICKRLVELMNGRIGFADREGGGTVFFFELPKHGAA